MTRAVGILAGAAMILLFATLMIVVMPTIQLQSGARVPEGLRALLGGGAARAGDLRRPRLRLLPQPAAA
jgi:hypothetical protein